jgi:dTDP-4-amino-4,6-dideoxygalactose transaminase
MDPILAVAKRHGLVVLEDAAEAHGAEYRGRRAGSLGAIGCFSFYGNKIITTGEGGMCVTNDGALADRLRLLAITAMDPKRSYWHEVIGFNYRMTNLQAAVGVAQVEKMAGFIEKKRQIARWYAEHLAELAKSGPAASSSRGGVGAQRVLDVLRHPERRRPVSRRGEGPAQRSRRGLAALLPPRAYAAALRDRPASARGGASGVARHEPAVRARAWRKPMSSGWRARSPEALEG